jgi:hypothetical protein
MERKLCVASLILLFTLGYSHMGFTQIHEISLDLGAGSSNTDSELSFVIPFFDGSSYYQVGGNYVITTNDELVNFYSGLSLVRKPIYRTATATFLKTPIGIQINYGRRFRFVLGGGINLGLLLSEDVDNYDLRKFSFGQFIKAGPAWQISDQYRLMLSYQANFDATVLYVERRTSPGGSQSNYDMKSYDGFLLLSLYKRLYRNPK